MAQFKFSKEPDHMHTAWKDPYRSPKSLDDPIKILHLVNSLAVNGRTRLLLDFIKYNEPNFSHKVVSLYNAGGWKNKLLELGIEVLVLGINKPKSNILGKFRILNEIISFKPDVIWCWSGLSNLVSLLPKFIGIPAIWSIHNSWERFESKFNRVGIWMSALLSRWVPFKIVCCSNASLDVYANTHKYNPEKLIVIRNGVNTQKFHPDLAAKVRKRTELGIPMDALLISFPSRLGVGQHGEVKDIQTLLNSVAITHQKRHDIFFIMFGPGINENNKELSTWLRNTGTKGSIKILGFRDDIAEIFAASDVVTLTSETEGLPLALIEAMACGCIPVCTDAGDVGAVIKGTGVIVTQKNPEKLALEFIKIATLESDARKAMSLRVVEKIRQEY